MKKTESLEKVGGGSMCRMWGERKTADSSSSFLRDYSLLNETAQFNCLEFMGLTIGEDYVSGVLGERSYLAVQHSWSIVITGVGMCCWQ